MEFRVAEKQKKERIDTYLVSRLPQVSRSRIKQNIDAGFVRVDGVVVKPSHLVSPGEIITLQILPRPGPSFEPEDIPLDIIFEDDNLVVVNKPPGLVVHPAHGNWSGTLMNALLWHNKELLELGENFRAGIVHRLDKDTSGLIVTAKDEYTLSELGKQFHDHTIKRTYQALVWGHPQEKSGIIEGNLGRSRSDRKMITIREDGKHAVTHYTVLKYFDIFSLLELKLETGRTHQIRVHLSHKGLHVFGDPTYGGRNSRFGRLTQQERIRCAGYLEIMKRQALHAKTLGFVHPIKKEFMNFDSSLPPDLRELLSRIEADSVEQ